MGGNRSSLYPRLGEIRKCFLISSWISHRHLKFYFFKMEFLTSSIKWIPPIVLSISFNYITIFFLSQARSLDVSLLHTELQSVSRFCVFTSKISLMSFHFSPVPLGSCSPSLGCLQWPLHFTFASPQSISTHLLSVQIRSCHILTNVFSFLSE